MKSVDKVEFRCYLARMLKRSHGVLMRIEQGIVDVTRISDRNRRRLAKKAAAKGKPIKIENKQWPAASRRKGNVGCAPLEEI